MDTVAHVVHSGFPPVAYRAVIAYAVLMVVVFVVGAVFWVRTNRD